MFRIRFRNLLTPSPTNVYVGPWYPSVQEAYDQLAAAGPNPHRWLLNSNYIALVDQENGPTSHLHSCNINRE